MNMSSRMPQPQGIMGNHANNITGQQSNQGQFMPQQGQFPSGQGGSLNVIVGMNQTVAKGPVPQVNRHCFTLAKQRIL